MHLISNEQKPVNPDNSDAPTVIVVGGGAAGLIAGKRAAEMGANVTILEKSERVGLKILISGGGKCNLTHSGSIEEIRRSFRRNEAFFLKPSLYKYTNDDFLEIIHRTGLKTYARPDGRIFPVEPANAKDIVAILERAVRKAGCAITTSAPVTGLAIEGGRAVGVRVAGETRSADRVIVAVGGSSYPATGTTGDGWRWAAECGHKLAPLRAALAPLYLYEPYPDRSGLSLSDVILRARLQREGKEYARWRGDLLFTHQGLSGPCALGISREISEKIASGTPMGGHLEVDLAPNIEFEALQTQIRTEMRENPRKTIGGFVDQFVPHRIIGALMQAIGIDAQTRGANLPAKQINKVANELKGWALGGVRSVPLERGEVVAGGVVLEEVDPQTMQSKRVENLYLCGEVLDIAGPVGGYNLQAAWSTGYVAGECAAKM